MDVLQCIPKDIQSMIYKYVHDSYLRKLHNQYNDVLIHDNIDDEQMSINGYYIGDRELHYGIWISWSRPELDNAKYIRHHRIHQLPCDRCGRRPHCNTLRVQIPKNY